MNENCLTLRNIICKQNIFHGGKENTRYVFRWSPEFLINLGNYKERLDHRLYIFVNALNHVSFILHNIMFVNVYAGP